MKPLERNPVFTNKLAGAPSLYLRQHAHNPVMWYPWSPEALELARAQDKPILLSVGYSSCYWCHVMEREVFENPSIAAYMNQHFINIKVDREEHPEIDEIYMVARQLLIREGGWPNNVFLTPELKPFFAGGTYAAQDMPERPAFPRLLEWLHHAWVEKRSEVEQSAMQTYELMQPLLRVRPQMVGGNATAIVDNFVPRLIEDLIAKHDAVAGGFHKQPKFLHETYLDFLISAGHVLDHKQALDVAAFSMLKMAAGGVYDQVGCGFHRYAVDRQWYVPHFEKMLYNQAMCASLYTRHFARTNNPLFADIARGTLEFVAGPMTSQDGGFYSAIDAETDGVEGAYYAWTAEELQSILSKEEIAFFSRYYALADIPHFPGHKKVNGQVIICRKSLWDAAKEDNLPFIQMAALSGQVMNKLLNQRNQRKAPLLDDKIITSWNGLMIAAYAEAFTYFAVEKYKQIAERAATFITSKMVVNDGRLQRIYGGKQAYLAGQLEDYSYLAYGLIELHRISPEKGWMKRAEQLLEKAEELFCDMETGQYGLNLPIHEHILVIQHATDSVLPSPVSVLLGCMVDIYEITGSQEWLHKANMLASTLARLINPATLPEYATLLKVLLKLKAFHTGDVSSAVHILNTMPQALPVVTLQAAFKGDTPPASGDTVTIEVTLNVLKDWYIYPHHATGNATRLEIKGEHVASVLSLEYPSPVKMKINGQHISGYRGEQQITAKVKLKSFQTRSPLEIILHHQPCSKGQCLAASTTKFKL